MTKMDRNLVLNKITKSGAMKKVKYTIAVQASAEKAFNTMLGLDDKSTYEQWTAVFNPTSIFRGSWKEGSTIHFIGTDEQGNSGGMVSRIKENRPNQFVSIEHYGILEGDREMLEGPKVDSWAGGLENYSFMEQDDMTTIIVEMDVKEEYIDYFNNTYPKALKKLKELIERA